MNLKPIFPYNSSIDQTNYYWFENGFTNFEVSNIESIASNFPYTQATIVSEESDDLESVRKSQIKWLHPNLDNEWLYDKLTNMVIEANTTWNFNIYSIIDSIQYTEYHEGGGHYDWHVDIGPNNIGHRKISIVVQLSDPSEYEGGDLEIWTGGNVKSIAKKKGVAVLFPSFLMHRVTPVTKGTRKSLVLWVGGESYK